MQVYYITAAWDNANAVPSTFTIGNGSKTIVNDITYENTNLESDTQYAVLYKIDITSDTDEVLPLINQ